jgi:hypothetical protein
MMGKALLAGALFGLAGSVLSMFLVCLPQRTGDDLEILPDVIQDLGLLRQGVDAKAEFDLRNRTSAPLRLLDVSTSCGCTGHKLSRTDIGAGESAVLTVTFNTAQSRGVARIHGVVVYGKAGEGQKQRTAFHVQAEIDPDYGVQPERLEFGDGRPVVERVVLWPRHIAELKLDKVVCDKSCFRARILPADASQRHVLEVTFLSQEYYADAGPAHVTVFTNSERQPTLRIPLDVSIGDESPGEAATANTRR